MQPNSQQYALLLNIIDHIHAAGSASALAGNVFPLIQELIPCDLIIFQYFLPASREPVLQFAHPEFPFASEEVAYYLENAMEFPAHAFIAKNPNLSTFRLSECLPVEQWREHHMYINCKARLGYLYTLMSYQGMGRAENGISLDRRGSDFTETESFLLDRLAKHLFIGFERLLESRGQRPFQEPLLHDWVATELGLSNREAEVMLQLRNGYRNTDLARKLGVSTATIKKHLENCYKKLGVKGRHQAIRVLDDLLMPRI